MPDLCLPRACSCRHTTYNIYNYPYFFAVFADCLNALAVGAPALPTLRIFSPDPAAMRLRFAWMLAYNPIILFFAITLSFYCITIHTHNLMLDACSAFLRSTTLTHSKRHIVHCPITLPQLLHQPN